MTCDTRFWVKFSSVAIVAAIRCPGTGSSVVSGNDLTGSGATFPFPIYSTWFKDYNHVHKDVQINYQGKGSGAGIKDLQNHTVDFAGSDAAMTDEEMAQVREGVQLLPMTAGSIVLAYNLPGDPKGTELEPRSLPKIFLAQIKKWDAPLIAKDNPGMKLPDLDITAVWRADASGTNFVFTKHLSAINEDWAKGPGQGLTVKGPDSNKIVAAPKNDGVTATIRQTPGAIGYIDMAMPFRPRSTWLLWTTRQASLLRPLVRVGPLHCHT